MSRSNCVSRGASPPQKSREKPLKYQGVPWVIVDQTYIRHTPTHSGRTSPTRSIREMPPLERCVPVFTHTETLFSETEIDTLKMASAFEENAGRIPLRKAPSRLEQLQSAQLELHPELSQTQSRKSSKFNLNQQSSQDDNDSIISLDDFDDPIEEELETHENTTVDSKPLSIQTGPVSQQEINEHVWLFCHESEKTDFASHIKPYNAQVYQQNEQTCVSMAPTAGRKKVLKALSQYSSVEQERELLKKPSIKIDSSHKRRVETSYAARKYKKYIYKNRKPMPVFLDELDFQKIKMNVPTPSQTQPISVRGRPPSIVHKNK